MNNKVSGLKPAILTMLSFITILIPVSLFLLWAYCAESRITQEDSVKMYHSYFPKYLNGRYTISFIALLFSFLSVILSVIYWDRRAHLLKKLNTIVFIAGCLMSMLYLFSLM